MVNALVEDLVEIPAERIDKFSPEELETVQYLDYCIQTPDEKGMLARTLWQLIAFGRITAHEVGLVLGAYDPEGIGLDEGATYDGWSADPVDLNQDDEDSLESADSGDTEVLPAASAEDDTVEGEVPEGDESSRKE